MQQAKQFSPIRYLEISLVEGWDRIYLCREGAHRVDTEPHYLRQCKGVPGWQSKPKSGHPFRRRLPQPRAAA